MHRNLIVCALYLVCVLFTVYAHSCNYAKHTITKVYRVKRDSHKHVNTVIQSLATAPMTDKKLYHVKASCMGSTRTISLVFDDQRPFYKANFHTSGLEHKARHPMVLSGKAHGKTFRY